MQLVVNGPEWAMSQEGSEIIYPDSATIGNGFQISRVKYIGGQWVQSPVPNGLNRIPPYFASFDSTYQYGGVTSVGLNPNTPAPNSTYPKQILDLIKWFLNYCSYICEQ